MGRRGTSGRLNLRMVGVLVYDITITSPAREPGQEPVGRSLSGTLWGNPLGKPSGDPRGNPLGKPSGKPSGKSSGKPSGKPSGDPRGSLGIDTTPLLPATSGSKMGDPHPPPHTGKGRKKGRKRGGYTHYFLNFSLGENPQTPPQLARRGRPTVGGKDKRGGARVWRAGRTKSIDLIETSSMELLSHSYLASLRSYNAPKFTPFPGVIRLYWWGKQG